MKKLQNHLKKLNIKFGFAFEGIYIKRDIINYELEQKISELGLKRYDLDTLTIIY